MMDICIFQYFTGAFTLWIEGGKRRPFLLDERQVQSKLRQEVAEVARAEAESDVSREDEARWVIIKYYHSFVLLNLHLKNE